jgi:hypothetical protein
MSVSRLGHTLSKPRPNAPPVNLSSVFSVPTPAQYDMICDVPSEQVRQSTREMRVTLEGGPLLDVC